MLVARTTAACGATLLVACLSTPPAAEIDASPPIDAPPPCAGGFAGATFDRTRELPTGYIGLAQDQTQGYVTSRVFAAPPGGRFLTLFWETVRPSLKALPDGRGREMAYRQGNADLAGNQLLFHFDDPPAWNDTSGNGLVTTCMTTPQNQCPSVVPGLFRDALDFDVDEDPGSDVDNDRVRVASIAALEPAQVTLEVWVRPSRTPTAGSRMMIVHKGVATPATPPYTSYSLEYNPDGTFRCYAYASAAGEEILDGGRVSAPLQWHHVACTYDGVALRLYVDGYADGDLPAAGELRYDVTGSPDVVLGNYSGAQFLDGQVDELAVHDRALPAAEVLERARRGTLRLAWQVRVCDDAACEGEDDAWRGPTGTATSYYTESCHTGLGPPTLALSDVDCDGDGDPDDGADEAVPAGAFYQVRALLDSHRPGDTPELVAFELCE